MEHLCISTCPGGGPLQGCTASQTSCRYWHQVPPKAQDPNPAVPSPTWHGMVLNIGEHEGPVGETEVGTWQETPWNMDLEELVSGGA